MPPAGSMSLLDPQVESVLDRLHAEARWREIPRILRRAAGGVPERSTADELSLSESPSDRLCCGRGFPGGDTRLWGRIRMAARFRSRGRGWFFRTKQPHHFTFLIALLLAIVGIVGARLPFEFISARAFWFVVAAYVVLALGCLIDGL
jgi:hypothetical protein